MSQSQAFRRILVAVDGSEVSLRAAEHAARIAKQDGAQLVALHVISSPSFEVTGGMMEYYDSARKEAKKWMKDIELTVEKHGLAAKTETVVGAFSVVDTIIGYAETNSIDLIVSGTRGRTPSARLRVGSVASALVEYADCSVLVIR